MRRSLPFLVLLLASVAACSGGGEPSNRSPSEAVAENSTDLSSEMAIPPELTGPGEQSSRETGPDLNPASTPGVAFDYRYAFRLEADRIAGMQQEQQRLCERYGQRCRITGMDYRAVNEEDVEAMLSFLVDPAIAGQFGRESERAVTAADGEVASSEINGTEVGTAIKTNTTNLEELQGELARIDARLARPRLHRRERARLEEERRALRTQIAQLRSTTEMQERQLATTPMLFRYGSGRFAPAGGRNLTVGEAAENAGDAFLGGIRILLIVFVTLSPWLLSGLLIWLSVRALRRRLTRPEPEASA